MRKSLFDVPGMDCPSEEQLVRLALDSVPTVRALRFDLESRRLTVMHDGPVAPIIQHLEPLGLGAELAASEEADDPAAGGEEAGQGAVLRQLLAINATMFVVELGLGLWAQSTGLVADSLDMLADALVYGVALYAVGRAAKTKRRAARMSGWLQLILACGALSEVARRAVVGSEPVEAAMIAVASVALVANLACVALLARHRDGGVHMRASWIFSTNDALANLGVIVAGVLVLVTGSAVPDLLVGAAVGMLVLSGAVRILRLR
jgi:Co/Zn/Cd efflux system component